MEKSFKVGDVVRLKSGGRKMTIVALEEPRYDKTPQPDTATCAFESRGGGPGGGYDGLRRETFPLAALDVVDPNEDAIALAEFKQAMSGMFGTGGGTGPLS